MNILFYSYDGFNPQAGGIGRVSFNLSNGLKAAGCNTFFVSLNEEGDYLLENSAKLPDRNNILSEENKEFLIDFIVSNGIDAIICQHSYFKDFSTLPHLAKLATNVKLFYVIHSTPNYEAMYIEETGKSILPSERTFSKNLKRIFRVLLKRAKQAKRMRKTAKQFALLRNFGDGIVLLSPHYISLTQKIAKFENSEKLFFIHNPNSYNFYNSHKEQKENLIIFVGRFAAEKKPEKALLIWEKIQHKYPDWRLVMIGDGVQFNDIETVIKQRKIERIELTGSTDPLPYYQKAKILIQPSDFEGWGMTITEGMQNGVVPVAFESFGALKDITKNRTIGEMVLPYDLDEFTHKLCKLIDSPARLSRMSQECVESVKNYDISTITSQWIKLLIS